MANCAILFSYEDCDNSTGTKTHVQLISAANPKPQTRHYQPHMAISYMKLSVSESESRLGSRYHDFYVASQLNPNYAHFINLI